MLRFDPKTGLSVSTTEEIRESVRRDWVQAFGPELDTDPATPAGQLIDSEAAMIATKDSELLFLANQFNPLTASGVWQDALGFIYFLSRKVAQPTLVAVTCTGLNGTTIPAGALVQTVTGLRLASVNPATIGTSGNVDVPFAAQETGPIPVGVGAVEKIITVIPGWDTATNLTAGVVGRYLETQADFERRRYASVAKNAHGSAAAVYGAIADLPDVVDVIVLENRGNDPVVKQGVTIEGHSVYISVYGGSDEDIARTIYNKLDAGCGTTGDTIITHIAADFNGAVYQYQITRPEPSPLYMKIVITPTESTPADIEDRIKAAVVSDFNGTDSSTGQRVQIGATVYASRFYAGIIAAGVQYLVEAKVSLNGTSWSESVGCDADQIPVIDPTYITVEAQNG